MIRYKLKFTCMFPRHPNTAASSVVRDGKEIEISQCAPSSRLFPRNSSFSKHCGLLSTCKWWKLLSCTFTTAVSCMSVLFVAKTGDLLHELLCDTHFSFCRAVLCKRGLCCHAVSVRPCLRLSVRQKTVKTNKHIFKIFHHRVATLF